MGSRKPTQVASRSEPPAITCCKSAQSRTVSVIGPTCSSEQAKATTPKRETVPYVGISPTRPQKAAGCRIEPPVSVPSDHGASPAATTAAEPPDEPPGTRVWSHGLRVGP